MLYNNSRQGESYRILVRDGQAAPSPSEQVERSRYWKRIRPGPLSAWWSRASSSQGPVHSQGEVPGRNRDRGWQSP